MPIPRENKIYTYKDYLSWPDNERWEIIDGNAYLMAPPSRIHQEILREIFTSFAVYLKDKPCRVYSAPFGVRLPSGDEDKVKVFIFDDLVIDLKSVFAY